MKSYRYLGSIEGALGGVGFVSPGKVIEPTIQAQVDKIESIIADDLKHKREPTFEEHKGKVTATNRATVPMDEAFGVYPDTEATSSEEPTVTKPASTTGAAKGDAGTAAADK